MRCVRRNIQSVVDGLCLMFRPYGASVIEYLIIMSFKIIIKVKILNFNGNWVHS